MIDPSTLAPAVVHLTCAVWKPLLQPLPVDRYWMWLMPPLLIAIAVVWKSIKIDDPARLPRQAASLAAQFVVLMIAAAAVLWLIVELV